MKRVVYTDHLKLRMKIRKIPKNYPKMIFEKPEQRYYDVAERNSIAIKRLRYNKKLRNMMIAYEEKNGEVDIITVHPITKEKIANRVTKGRWIK